MDDSIKKSISINTNTVLEGEKHLLRSADEYIRLIF